MSFVDYEIASWKEACELAMKFNEIAGGKYTMHATVGAAMLILQRALAEQEPDDREPIRAFLDHMFAGAMQEAMEGRVPEHREGLQ